MTVNDDGASSCEQGGAFFCQLTHKNALPAARHAPDAQF